MGEARLSASVGVVALWQRPAGRHRTNASRFPSSLGITHSWGSGCPQSWDGQDYCGESRLLHPWKHLEISPNPYSSSRENLFHSEGKQMLTFFLLSPASSQVPQMILELPCWLSSLDFCRAALELLPPVTDTHWRPI